MPYVCDGHSAGVLLGRCGQVLLGERVNPPEGLGPPCGHVKDHDPTRGHRQAAIDETDEEFGLIVAPEDMVLVYERWLPNRCGAAIPAAHRGHHWKVYRAEVWDGTVALAPAEMRSYQWHTPRQLQRAADRTIAYATGRLGRREWKRSPGLEAAWVDILAHTERSERLGDTYIRVPTERDLRAVRAMYEAAPN